MLLFRYSNYRKTNFIDEHKAVIDNNGYSWLLKAGKKSDMNKLKAIIDDGGGFILKSPHKDGNKYFVCFFTEVKNDEPNDTTFPKYYNDFLDDNYDYYGGQWFKITSIQELPDKYIGTLCLQKDGKKLEDVLPTTRTAVMFITNDMTIKL